MITATFACDLALC
jgi:hypothetical protein